MKSKILRNSGIYSILNLLQKGINFLLVPVLTVYLTTFDYGIISVVASINAFLNVFYLLSLNGSLNRFYYEYKDDEDKVNRLFGTIVTFVFGFSIILTLVLLLTHQYVLDPFLDEISFYPYMLVGMITALFSPVFTIYQNTLQAKQNGTQFGKNNLLFFITNITFLLIAVIVLELGALGVIGALALTNFIFFIYTLTKFGKDIKIGIDRPLLKQSLNYALPLVPHSLSGVVTNVIDRLFVNKLLSTSLTGIYSLGSTFGSIVFLIASGINQAFVPWFNEQVKANNVKNIPTIAKLLVLFYCFIALGLSFFGKEVIAFVTPESYHQAWVVIPFIAFAFVYHGVYYFFAGSLFYDIQGRGTKIIPISTISAATINIALNILLIPQFGIIGAAVSTLLAKFILCISLKFFYKKYLNLKYPELFLIFVPLLFFSVSLLSFYDDANLIIKIVIYLVLLIVVIMGYKSTIKQLIQKGI
ncbi:oligosaccharide flippase family protein [Tamlana sp. 2_MG-2023]|uniref:lipopolysaccharide biosynthesis protein n=1 Tax=unclassified Tamlana TaxID=2614803 RepID=UPI0026E44DB8|nr:MULTISPECIES: oligosaccharide flippase family protein [unclassified Tamlana]MDO6759749.1 oligosaccharide flippase family protein [Tamlana sp. 2_MG-2023]MDO6791372.1 oligosaccharide flippase family protein [Tamlana sp. 1_MG-2023]